MPLSKKDTISIRHMLEFAQKALAFSTGRSQQDLNWDEQLTLLLVTPTLEFLLRHPKQTQDWDRGKYDSLLQSNVF